MDVVTSMALSMGTPSRPTRVSPSFSDRIYGAGSQPEEKQHQSFWRICDLLFYGEELPVAMSMLVVLQGLESAERGDEILKTLLSVFQDNHQHLRLIRASVVMQLRREVHCKEVLEGASRTAQCLCFPYASRCVRLMDACAWQETLPENVSSCLTACLGAGISSRT